MSRRVSKVDVVKNVESPTARVSKDRHSALVQFDIKGDPEKAGDKIDPVLAAVAAAQRANPSCEIEQFGDASADKELDASFEEDLQKAEKLSLPVTLVILLIAFGALVGGGRAAAAGALGRDGDDGPRRAAEPHLPDRRRVLVGDPADRPGGRRRLLALLHEARARGAGQGIRRRRPRCSAPRPRPDAPCWSPA